MKDTDEVAVFWDYENCPVPTNVSGYTAVNHVRSLAHPYGSVKLFKAYLGLSDPPSVQTVRSQNIRSELQVSGVSLIDCPHNGRKEVADKMIIVDMLGYAMDNPAPTTIILISGDRDFAYALSFLRLRRYRIILMTLPNAHISLTAQASVCLDWAVNDSLTASSTIGGTPMAQNKSPLLLQAPRQNPLSADTQHSGQQAQYKHAAHRENFLLTGQQSSVQQVVGANKGSSSAFTLSPPMDPVIRPSSTNTSSGGSSKYLTPTVSPQSYYNLTLSQTSAAVQYRNTVGLQVTSPTESDASEVTTSSSNNSYSDESTGNSSLDIPAQSAKITVSTRQSPTPKVNSIAPVIPKIYHVLVLYLQKLRAQGQHTPLRSQVAVAIAKGGETYRLAGVQRFGQYVAEAQKEGIVILGGLDGTAWIALTPSWYYARAA